MVVNEGYREWLDKATEFLKTHMQDRCSDYDPHEVPVKDKNPQVVGIKFLYSFFEFKDSISVDMFLCPNFSNLEELLTFLQKLGDEKRRQ